MAAEYDESAKFSKQDVLDENGTKLNMLFPMPDEFENLDSINDETFGLESFESEWVDKPNTKVDEFEEWLKQQKELSINKEVPLDEAPPREQSEEKLAQAISKLDSIGIMSPKETEVPLPNAHAIEALWPTSPKHSSNIVTPDHSPYHMSDLFSPSHNIWGSPSSDAETNEAEENECVTSHVAKSFLDHEDNRKLYSPVLEDEAIVSALPKRIPKPIRVEEIEKMGFGNQMNQLPPNLRPFVNGVSNVRPPPGFPPNARNPFPIHSSPYVPSPIPPVPQHVTLAQAQAQALYTAMMNQRMGFPQAYPRTPPPQHRYPRPLYHSDPGHMRQRGPGMPIPHQHGRFITPQPRNTWNNTRGGRNYDNRRRQQNFSESPSLKYIPQYYVGNEEDDEGDGGTLMTAKEKDWIIRIQLMQLTSDNPELDDYYFHTFERRRLAKERAQSTVGVEPETNHSNKDVQMTLPHVTKGEHNYKPTKFEGSLGQVSVGSIFHPREVVQVADSGKPKGPVGSLKETKKKYQLLLTIEKGFDQILPIEDLERMVLQVPQDVRPQLREKRERLCQRCFDLLNIKPSKDSNKRYDDDTFLQMLSVRKGRRLLGKLLRVVSEDQRHEIALAVTRNLRIFIKKDVHNEETESLSAAVTDVVRSSPPERIIEHHNNVVGTEASVLHLFGSKFTLRILAVVLKRMSELSKNIVKNSSQLYTLWCSFLSVICRDFVTASPKVLVKNYNDVQNIVDVLGNNVDDDKLLVIREHFRLVENAHIHSPQR